jgi:hypothetical protein
MCRFDNFSTFAGVVAEANLSSSTRQVDVEKVFGAYMRKVGSSFRDREYEFKFFNSIYFVLRF